MAAPEPRLSSTVLLIRDRGDLEVLMVERHEATYFASALVFPGGVVDPDDFHDDWLRLVQGHETLPARERALRIAGFRELYEETGLLLVDRSASSPEPKAPAAPEARFIDLIDRMRVQLDLGAMHPFAHWITPESSPKRYDTHFRLCGIDTEVVAVSDGRETVSVEWVRPRDALERGAAGRRKLLFPTRLNLELLARASSVNDAIAAAKGRTITTITPRVERRPEGVFITVPSDAGYGPAEEFVGRPPA